MFSEGWRAWYDSLKKPGWTPSARIIGIIWTVLYPLIFLTLTIVLYLFWLAQIGSLTLLPFLANLAFNLAFTPILFRLRNLQLARIDISLVWLTILWEIVAIYPTSLLLVMLQIPYLTWVTIASAAQFSITSMNRSS